jgi:xylan 1,4-beta-xylosidase
VIRNPVLRGFNPDPSITRVGEDYYLATSTLVWQPGIRLFHSTDLASWSLIGHGLTAGEHDLRGLASHQGIWAPCLTFSRAEGLFYLTYSLVHSTTAQYFDVDNFVVTTSDVHGPWSRPVYLNSIGFDPSFFHDDDGRHWLLTLEWDPRDGYEHPGAIVLEEFDAERKELRGSTSRIYRGGSDRGCLEAPHLYRRSGFYYLMAAEGGTGYGHSVTLARSRDIDGPYQPAPVNPFLTSNPAPHFGRNDRDFLRPQLYNPHADLQKAGHGCLVDTPTGEWYVAHLCARPLEPNQRSVLGRETAIQKVEWTDDGWLRLTTGGTLPRLLTLGLANKTYSTAQIDHERLHDDFDGPAIDIRFSTLRRPWSGDWASLSRRRGALSIKGGEALTSRFDVSVVATQLQAFDAVAETQVSLRPRHFSHSAGLAVLYDNKNFAYLRLYHSESLRSNALGIVLVKEGTKQELLADRAAVDSDEVVLQVRVQHGALQFGWRLPNEAFLHEIGPEIDATYMSDEATRGFTGTMIGMACVDSYRRNVLAHFDYFDLQHGSQALHTYSSVGPLD